MESATATSLLIGFVTSLSLIVAIGAQNAFVLRQGLRGEHVLPVVLVCAVSDAVLISAGITGLGALLTSQPEALAVARYGGAAFLLAYGVIAARRAFRSQSMAAATGTPAALAAVVLTCLGFTYLNPHVYLDTVVLLGALANQHGSGGRWWFGLGAVTASFAWFFGLGYFARRLGPLFTRPIAWRILDATIAAVMLTLALWLVL
jgi:L-lysine exporter family protein LysE/ArgO